LVNSLIKIGNNIFRGTSGGLYTLSMTGPNAFVNVDLLDFDNVQVGTTVKKTVKIINLATTNTLSITGVTTIANYNIVPNPPAGLANTFETNIFMS
jgi:hypothetical protein